MRFVTRIYIGHGLAQASRIRVKLNGIRADVCPLEYAWVLTHPSLFTMLNPQNFAQCWQLLLILFLPLLFLLRLREGRIKTRISHLPEEILSELFLNLDGDSILVMKQVRLQLNVDGPHNNFERPVEHSTRRRSRASYGLIS